MGVSRDVSSVLQANMAEQICSFVGDMETIEHIRRHTDDHHPVMLSWTQAMALMNFARSRGYSAFGHHEELDNSKKAA